LKIALRGARAQRPIETTEREQIASQAARELGDELALGCRRLALALGVERERSATHLAEFCELIQTLAEEDVVHLAAAMDPGSAAGVLVYENLWAAPFASAMRRAGGQLIANGRIPVQALIAAIEADEAEAALEPVGV